MHSYIQNLLKRQNGRGVKLLKTALLSLFLLTGSNVFALDVNKATSAELQTIDGVGPVIAERILKERSRGGKFTSKANLIERVRGVGDKTAGRITSGSGLKKGASSKVSKKASSKTRSSKETQKSSDTRSASKTVSKKSAAKKSAAKKASTSKASTKAAETKVKPPEKSAKKSAKKSDKKSDKKSTKKSTKKKSAKKTSTKKKAKKKPSSS